MVGVIIVGIPLAIHSVQLVQHGQAMVAVAEGVADWAPELTLENVSIHHSSEPIEVAIAVTGSSTPSDASALADRLAARWDRAVDVDVVFVPIDSGSAAAP